MRNTPFVLVLGLALAFVAGCNRYSAPEYSPRQYSVPENMSIHDAARKGDTRAVKVLLDRGANVKGRGQFRETPLHLAAFKGHTETAKLLLKSGAQVNARDEEGQTPLHAAACTGQYLTARLLIEHGADVNAKDWGGTTPWFWATYYGQTDMAALLLTRGANVKWGTVIQCSGKSSSNTRTFVVGGEWAIQWATQEEYVEGLGGVRGNFIVQVKQGDRPDAFGDLVINTMGRDSGTTYQYTPGKCYLEITATQPWSVIIWDKR